jgi:hypothetical protein
VKPLQDSESSSKITAPLIIGVTGHCDLRDEDIGSLRKKVREVFEELQAKVPSTNFLVLSALAEGADRLVARVALEFGARLIAPLPMPVAEYDEDFKTQESLDEFHSLLARAEYSFVTNPPSTCSREVSPEDRRNLHYEGVGKFIAAECQILIALWDGYATGLTGGTGEVVRFQSEGIPLESGYDIDPPECFPVYQIVTPRKSSHPAAVPFTLNIIYPKAFGDDDTYAEKYYDDMFKRLDEFNKQVQMPDRKILAEVEESKRFLFNKEEETRLNLRQNITFQRYAFADALARGYQASMVRTQRWLHGVVFASFIFFVFYAHSHWPSENWYGWLILSVLCLSVGIGFWGRARKSRIDENYQDYRAVAEGLRVKLFWNLAGITDRITNYYLRKLRTELDWIRNGLRGWYLDWENGGETPGPECSETGLGMNWKCWIQDQHRYFKRAAKRYQLLADKFELGVRLLLAIGAAVAFLLTVFELVSATHPKSVRSYALIAIEALLACAALANHYSESMAFTELAKQYARMQSVFYRACSMIEQSIRAQDLVKAKECLRKLGQEALAENGDWVLLHRERPLKIPDV